MRVLGFRVMKSWGLWGLGLGVFGFRVMGSWGLWGLGLGVFGFGDLGFRCINVIDLTNAPIPDSAS
jgi:hypothetical protein